MTGRIEQIQARLEAATPGPWDRTDAQIRHTQIDGWVHPMERAEAQRQTEADIQFVMNAPSDLAYLLAEVEELKEWRRNVCRRTRELMDELKQRPEWDGSLDKDFADKVRWSLAAADAGREIAEEKIAAVEAVADRMEPHAKNMQAMGEIEVSVPLLAAVRSIHDALEVQS